MTEHMPDRLATLTARVTPTALGAVGLLATVAALAVVAGPLGAVVGVGLALVGLFAPPVAVFGLGQAALLALLPSPTPLQLALVEGALFLVLVGPATKSATGRLVALGALLFAGLGTSVWYGAQTFGIQAAGIALLLGVGVVAYVLHRYERVVVGLAGGDAA
ncbi:hypothetical protein [Halorarius litoreus]|uniref:hypothetical protein n=1 Tax=Halorarius litoreus TaxID=2962676 RepID=UPI0020CF98CD|nr:hypothetical protein [Halorarius litoreus]